MKLSIQRSLLAVLGGMVVLLAAACTARDLSPTRSPPESGAVPAPGSGQEPLERHTAQSASSNLRFDHISVGEGLAHATVNCIIQDRYGFIWLATEDGLNRYDGYDMIVYRHSPADPHSLSNNRVRSLFEDSSGVLWVGTYGGGLNRFDRDAGQFTHYDADDFQNVTDEPEEFRNLVLAIDEVPAGVLWIATYGGGLVRFDRDTERFTSYAPDPADSALAGHEWITAMLVDRSGLLWIGTNSVGLDRFDPATGRFTTFRHDPQDPASLGHDWISALLQDRSGRIWIGTEGRGLDRFDPETGTFIHYRHDPADPDSLSNDNVWSLSEDSTGLIWIGTAGGLDAHDPDGGGFAHFGHDPTDPGSLSSDRILWVEHDQSGTLWAGTWGGGVSKSDPASARFTHYRGDPGDAQRPADYPVQALLQDLEGALWIGTPAGLDRLDLEAGEWKHYRKDPADPGSLGNDSVQAIFQDASGILWLGTMDGFYRLDPEAQRFDRLPHNPPDPGQVQQETIYAITQDQTGVLWLGTHGRGVSEFDPSTGGFTYHLQAPEGDGPSNSWVHDLIEDASGNLWFATQDGLNRLDRETGEWRWFQHDPDDAGSLSHNWVMALHQDRAGSLWVGTLGGGLDRLDIESATFAHHTGQDGLANNVVLEIVSGGGHLWIATANGLSRFDPDTGTFTSYGAGDGLPLTEFMSAYQGDSGELFFGGVNGFISLDPGLVAVNAHVPPVVLTSMNQNGVAVNGGQALENLHKVTFRWPENSFEFGFAALNYTQPENNQHAYKLEGFDRNWNHIGSRRFGRYTNLPGGSYTLRLKGSNNDGVWNEEGVAIQVTIVPPFWQTVWFWGAVALVLLGGAFGGYRLRVRRLEERSRGLERQVAERTAALQQEVEQRVQAEETLRRRERQQAVAEERSRLARELHDSVTQSLYGVSLYSEAAAGQLAQGQNRRASEHLAELQETAQEALAEMRLLVFELRPPILEQEGLVAAVQARLQAVEGRAGLKTEFRTNLEERLPLEVEEGLYRIAVEALNNVLKHAGAHKIKVHLRQDRPARADSFRVTLRIIDDGIGFDLRTARASGGMGLAAMDERAEAIGAVLRIEGEGQAGTEISVAWQPAPAEGMVPGQDAPR